MDAVMDKVAGDVLTTFRTSQGVETRANLLRFTRFLAVLETHSLDTILQNSEVLTDFKIVCNNRVLYSGRAVVRNQINTGLSTAVEVALEESWTDMDYCVSMTSAGRVGVQFNAFFEEWQKLYRVLPEYKVAVADLHTFLTDLRLWVEQLELGIRCSPEGDRAKLEREVARQLEESTVSAIAELFGRFELVAQPLSEELQPIHRSFGKRLIHPLLLTSPFVYRTFRKPLGYAGDYEMVNMMFRDPYEGASLFGKVINAYALRLPPILGHRHRIAFLFDRLVEEALRAARAKRRLRVFNLGCGPAHEIQRFMSQSPLSNEVDFTLWDFNNETITHSTGILNQLRSQYNRKTGIQLLKRSVQQLIKQAERHADPNAEKYDCVYCAGLFDYLTQNICCRLMDIFYDMLAPGGLLLATNVDVHPSRGQMEHFLEWHLIHRNTAQMMGVTPAKANRENVTVLRDTTGVNVFLAVRKSEA